jgi:hypothetical protein
LRAWRIEGETELGINNHGSFLCLNPPNYEYHDEHLCVVKLAAVAVKGLQLSASSHPFLKPIKNEVSEQEFERIKCTDNTLYTNNTNTTARTQPPTIAAERPLDMVGEGLTGNDIPPRRTSAVVDS